MSETSKVIVYIAASLDGFIAKEDGDVSWLSPADLPQEDYGYNQFMQTVDSIIMGKKTYEKILTLAEEFPYKDKCCYVLSRKIQDQKDDHVIFYQGNIQSLIHELKRNTKKNIYINGGAEVIHALRKEFLIDEYILFIAPILLGSGISLFKEAQTEERLTLLDSHVYLSGYVRLHYQTKMKM